MSIKHLSEEQRAEARRNIVALMRDGRERSTRDITKELGLSPYAIGRLIKSPSLMNVAEVTYGSRAGVRTYKFLGRTK